jgi:hypothetical protein
LAMRRMSRARQESRRGEAPSQRYPVRRNAFV